MRRYITKRLLGFIVVLIGVSILSFLLLAFSGKDPAEIMARRSNINASQETIEAVRMDMGLDKPLPARYANWVKGFFTGDLGISLVTSKEISKDLAAFFPVTLALVGMALFWIVLFSVPISLLCARFRNGVADQITRGLTLAGICVPTFWLGFLLLLAFAVKLPFFKVLPEPGIKGYILPSLALAFPVACGMIRLFRSTLLSELSSDYVRYAKARGVPASRILTHHVIRNALPPIVTVFCQYLGYLIAGGAVIESVFTLKGIGTYLIESVMASDSTSVATCIVMIAVIFVSANLLGDLINRFLCPWMVRESNA